MFRKVILIVEDDHDIQESLLRALHSEGFDVLQAFNGEEALAVLSTAPELPSMILLDWMMPIMSGQVFFSKFKEDYPDHFAAIPVILISAMATPEEAASIGAAHLLPKPFDMDQLFNVIQKHCP